MKTYKAIIYDIDGTVLDTLKMNMIPLMKIIEEETGKKITYEEVLKYAPYPGMKVMEELQVDDKEKTYARWVKYVNEYKEGATLYKGFEEVFKTFDGNIKQAVVSAKTKEQYIIDFVDKGLDKYMEVAILADDTRKHKPDPEPINLCIEKLGLTKEDVIYIGDAFSDYQCCKNAGIDFGYASWGSVSAEGIDNPTYTFTNPLELLCLQYNNINLTSGSWLNEPKQYTITDDAIILTTEANTDFWQTTNYGYQRNSGHAYLFSIDREEYTFSMKASFKGNLLYDQCGVFIYNDPTHWAKASLENEDASHKMLGAVVTNRGYSDWSISGLLEVETVYYRVHKKGQDFLIESSLDGKIFNQIRMFHLQDISTLQVGMYACSPMESSFDAQFSECKVVPLMWNNESYI